VRYSNLHFTLAGRVLEAVAGRTWKEFLRSRLLEPAGLHRTFVDATRMWADADVALPTLFSKGGFAPASVRKTDRTMHAAGGMGSTADDLARWIRLQLGRGSLGGERVLPEAVVAGTWEPQVEVVGEAGEWSGVEGRGFGLAWQLGRFAGERTVSHGGGFIGAAAHVSFLPDRGLGVAVVMNRVVGPLAEIIATDVYDRLLGRKGEPFWNRVDRLAERAAQGTDGPATPEGSAPRRGAGLTRDAAAYAGAFTNPTWGTIEFAARGETLECRFGDLPVTLASTGDDRFVAAFIPRGVAPGEFEIEDDGTVTAVLLEMGSSLAPFERDPEGAGAEGAAAASSAVRTGGSR
jgi:CubicO group peptidase (beta-lactamase class C family)